MSDGSGIRNLLSILALTIMVAAPVEADRAKESPGDPVAQRFLQVGGKSAKHRFQVTRPHARHGVRRGDFKGRAGRGGFGHSHSGRGGRLGATPYPFHGSTRSLYGGAGYRHHGRSSYRSYRDPYRGRHRNKYRRRQKSVDLN